MIELRDARFTDCLAVWRWNCAPDVRAQSKRRDQVELADHARWFVRRLRTGEPTWIVEENGTPVGIVRLDREGEHARISIALADAARGRGIGREAIEIACRRTNEPVVAEVVSSNMASQKCFEACGFVPIDRGQELVTYRWSK